MKLIVRADESQSVIHNITLLTVEHGSRTVIAHDAKGVSCAFFGVDSAQIEREDPEEMAEASNGTHWIFHRLADQPASKPRPKKASM